MPNEMETLKNALFEIFAAGFEAGYSKEKDLRTAFEEWYKMAMLMYMPPNTPYTQ